MDAGVSHIDMDMKNFGSGTTPLSMRIALQGPGSTQYGSTNACSVPADDQWHDCSFGLTSSDLTLLSGSASLDDVLSNVNTLRILAADARPTWRGDAIRARLGVDNIMGTGSAPPPPPKQLQAGDADQDLDFDQFDLIKVQIAAKYLTGQSATWGEGDWNAAPGGMQGAPPPGDGRFNQFDIIAAQQAAVYLTGPYAALAPAGRQGDGQTSIIYDTSTGHVSVDAPAGTELTSINIDSAAGIFTGAPAQNLGGSFDNDADNNIFKATFGSSFGSLSFGNVAQTGLLEQFVLDDLTVVGSLAGGGALGDVDLVYVSEPSSLLLHILGVAVWLGSRRHHIGSKESLCLAGTIIAAMTVLAAELAIASEAVEPNTPGLETNAVCVLVNGRRATLRIPESWTTLPADSGYLYLTTPDRRQRITLYAEPLKKNQTPDTRCRVAIDRLQSVAQGRPTSCLREITRGRQLQLPNGLANASWMYRVIRPHKSEIRYWTIAASQDELMLYLELRWEPDRIETPNSRLTWKQSFFETFQPICQTLVLEMDDAPLPIQLLSVSPADQAIHLAPNRIDALVSRRSAPAE